MPERRIALWAPVGLGIVLLLVWGLVVRAAALPEYVLPHPLGVVRHLLADLRDAAFLRSLLVTTLEALGGTALAVVVSAPVVMAIHASRWFAAAVNPFLGASQAVPAIALAPLLVLWVGYGTWPIVVLCALMVFFPVLVQAVVGLRLVDPALVDAARLDGASGWAVLRHIEAPLASPNALAGLRTGSTLSITGAVVGEMVMGGNGLGEVLTVQRDRLDTTGMFATIVVLCALASAVYTLVRALETRARRETTPARD